jgi:hypothetical protein
MWALVERFRDEQHLTNTTEAVRQLLWFALEAKGVTPQSSGDE